MAIGMAVKKGSFIYVYDDKNRQLFTRAGDLHGYTSSTVTVKSGSFLYTYNESGSQVAVMSAQ